MGEAKVAVVLVQVGESATRKGPSGWSSATFSQGEGWAKQASYMYEIEERALNFDSRIKNMENENYEYEKFLFLLIQLCLISRLLLLLYKRCFSLLMALLVVCD